MTTKGITLVAEPDKYDLTMIREFEAPRELVFKAHIDATWLTQWLSPRGYDMRIEKFDAHSGGAYRYIHIGPKGEEYAFRGTFHEVSDPVRIIQTFEFEGMPETGHVCLDTVNFEILPHDRTRVTTHSIFQSVEDRDGMIESGMEKGVNDGYEKLDELLKKELAKSPV
jgi:uncharacterized protein YndB with AHSA1/START domain